MWWCTDDFKEKMEGSKAGQSGAHQIVPKQARDISKEKVKKQDLTSESSSFVINKEEYLEKKKLKTKLKE